MSYLIKSATVVTFDPPALEQADLRINGEYIVVLHDGSEMKLSRSRREQLQTLLKSGAF